ncbi:MAG: hypothetical protein Q7T60_16755 [Sphingopyxis sp.]|nr:hypothetical protein [Sphingopyxis sp.]
MKLAVRISGALMVLVLISAGQASAGEGTWRGDISSEPLILASPLDPLPTVHENARRIALPFSPEAFPAGTSFSDREDVGTVRLLVARKEGWLIGTDAGEWVGGLFIVSPTDRKLLAKGNILGGFSWHGHFYILSGLRHMFTNEGELWEVDFEAGRITRRISLPTAPEDILITKDEMIIVRTGKGDVALLKDGTAVDLGTL